MMKLKIKITGLFLICLLSTFNSLAQQETFLGEVKMFAGNFAPRGWALCQGQLLPISQNDALFSILGTTYGGDGRTTFGLPDLRGRVAMGPGNGPGLTSRKIGQEFGTENQYLSILNMPAHNHVAVVTGGNVAANVAFSANRAVRFTPQEGDVPAAANYPDGLTAKSVKSFGPASNIINGQIIPNTLPTVTTGMAGSGQGFSIVQPTQVINYIICTIGTFPIRS
ncbi:phage tail protein [Algibacter lectus]|nr:tail fiber protein [Algibacter lectus]